MGRVWDTNEGKGGNVGIRSYGVENKDVGVYTYTVDDKGEDIED